MFVLATGLRKTSIRMCDHLSKPAKIRHRAGAIPSSRSYHKRKVSQRLFSSQSLGTTSRTVVDPELIDLQKRLIFTDAVRPFYIARPRKRLIYTGDLYAGDSSGRKFYAILLRNLLVLTRQQGSHLVVVDQPVKLSEIIAFDTPSLHCKCWSLC